MNQVSFDLASCYGIKTLKTLFDFSQHPTVAIYAPNGMMKTSLARTLDDLAKRKKPSDRIDKDAVPIHKVLDENSNPLDPDSILVFGPYDKNLDPSKRISNLLLSKDLKAEYDAIVGGIEESKEALLLAVKEQAGTKLSTDKIEADISNCVMLAANEFLPALARLKSDFQNEDDVTPFADLEYDIIFDPKVLEFLATPEAKELIENYVKSYNELLDKSQFFTRAAFNYYEAQEISDSLTKHRFFKAGHTVRLKSRLAGVDDEVIKNSEDLTTLIEKEKQAVLTNPDLKKRFDDFATKSNRNNDLRKLIDYLQQHETWLAELQNPKRFRMQVWKSYLKANFSLYTALVNKYETFAPTLKDLKAQAAAEKTRWEEVVTEFTKRFSVPFKLAVINKIDACVGEHQHVELSFTFTDGAKTVPLDRNQLTEILSTGQNKAFYILNILFELYARQEAGRETLVVLDDIVDSFDYQNKYAIIQYLQDLNEDGRLFKQIIMTHNFDFLRTMVWRGVVVHDNCFMANRNANGEILLESRPAGVKDMFSKVLKDKYATDPKCAIACIPFLRNLREIQTDDTTDDTYLLLTALLHWKPGKSEAISRKDLDQAFEKVFTGRTVKTENGEEMMVNVIQQEAEKCLMAPDGINFENKLILSIAIRLISDRYMIAKIADDSVVSQITGRHTNNLFKEYKKRFSTGDPIEILKKVILMTPENIHLNSFMYEPIIDMSDHRLRELYKEVRDLK